MSLTPKQENELTQKAEENYGIVRSELMRSFVVITLMSATLYLSHINESFANNVAPVLIPTIAAGYFGSSVPLARR